MGFFSFSELYEHEVVKWKEDDVFFVETHNFSAMLDKVKKQSYVTFVGIPGSGKSATARHIALQLQEEGYEILPIREIRDIETYCDPRNPQVFIIDDVLGVIGLDITELNLLNKYQDRVIKPIMPQSKTLMTCREAVYRNEILGKSHFLLEEKHTVWLHSVENALTDKDKRDIFMKYNLDINMLSSQNISKASDMFPYLCNLLSRTEEFKEYCPKFFISPVPCILKLLDEMQTKNKIQYASLVLLMASQNKLTEEMLDNEDNERDKFYFHKMKKKIMKKCKVQSTTESFQFIDALSEMQLTFTQNCNCQFTFIHDYMFEVIAYHFGSRFPELILQFMSSDYIANYIKVATISAWKTKVKTKNDLCITIPGSLLHSLAERLYEDVKNGEFYNVFMNESLKHSSVFKAFIGLIQGMPYTELQSVFLSEIKETSKVLEGYSRIKYNFSCQMGVIFGRTKNYLYSARAISWIIYFGHNQILHSIIKKIIRNNGNANEVFLTATGKSKTCGSDIERNRKYKHAVNIEGQSMLGKSESEEDIRILVGESAKFMTGDEDSDSDYESRSDPITVEQRRLLCLGCCSGDLTTVKILLNNVDKDVFNVDKVTRYEVCSGSIEPLFIACEFGFENIAIELIKVGSDVNFMAGLHTPMTIACEKGHLSVVKELIKAGAHVNLHDGFHTPLIAACKYGHLNVVKELIKTGADVDLDYGYCTPLKAACDKRHFLIIEELINSGANVNLKQNDFTLLISICESGDFNKVKQIIKAGADVNQSNGHRTALIAACLMEDVIAIMIVKVLIEAHADVNLKDGNRTPLTSACEKANADVVDELINAGANVNLNDGYITPLTAACLKGNIKVIKSLVKAGADVNSSNGYRTPLISACEMGQLHVVTELIKSGADVNLIDRQETPLIAACYSGHFYVVEKLIQAGANINLSDGYRTPLITSCETKNEDLVEILIKAGADVNLKDVDESSGHKTPLINACEIGYLNIVESLIKFGANVNQICGDITPLLTACSMLYQLNIVKRLINAGACVNLKCGNETPLTAACKIENVDAVEELINAGADVNASDGYYTPLIVSCLRNNQNIVTTLLKSGAKVNLTDGYNTPLTAACLKGDYWIVKELIKWGADVNFGYNNKTPLTVVCKMGNWHVLGILREAGADIDQCDGFWTPLTSACEEGHMNVVRDLIESGVNVQLSDGLRTPLITACIRGHLDIVNELVKAGADATEDDTYNNLHIEIDEYLLNRCNVVEQMIKTTRKITVNYKYRIPLVDHCDRGHLSYVDSFLGGTNDIDHSDGLWTLLTRACDEEHVGLVRILIQLGANVNLTDGFNTPLTTACLKGYYWIVFELIKWGADVNLRDENRTPLTTVCKRGHACLIDILIKAGADINLGDGFLTPLTSTCEEGHLGVVKELIKLGADINVCDGNRTPLIAACVRGRLSIVEELIKAGVDVNLSYRYRSPIMAARKRGHIRVVKRLMEAGANENQEEDYTYHAYLHTSDLI